MGRFMVPRQGGSVRYSCNKFEADRSFRSKIIRGPKFRPAVDPFPGARDGQNLISWRWSLPLPTNSVWWGSMHVISSYRGNIPTNTHKQTHKPTDRTDYNTLRRSFASAQCVIITSLSEVTKWRQSVCRQRSDNGDWSYWTKPSLNFKTICRRPSVRCTQLAPPSECRCTK